MDGYTIGMVAGILMGLAIGISLGISIGRKQKPWSELSKDEKRNKKIIIGIGVIILLIGLILNTWLFFRF